MEQATEQPRITRTSARGAEAPRNFNESELHLMGDVKNKDTIQCPDDLDRTSKTIWRKTRLLVNNEGRWRPEYSLLLERYVRALEVGRFARKRISDRAAKLAREGKGDEMAYLTHGSQGQLVQHPDLKTARDAEKDANEYARELLLTPAARAKIGDNAPTAPKGGKFDGAFG